MTRRFLAAAVTAAIVMTAAACGDASGPEFRPNVLATTDSFRFRAAGLDQTTDTLVYSWTNALDSARITHIGAVTGGSGTVIVRAPGGAVLYQASIATSGTFGMARGVAGSWEIEVRLGAATGNFEFKVEPLP